MSANDLSQSSSSHLLLSKLVQTSIQLKMAKIGLISAAFQHLQLNFTKISSLPTLSHQ
jgi:hypothetical protein